MVGAMRKFIKMHYKIKHFFSELYWNIRSIFIPAHPIIRKALPRRWSDITNLITEVNLAFIKQFHEEATSQYCYVDWNHHEEIKAFFAWLKSANNYVSIERPALEKQMEDAYPKFVCDISDHEGWLNEINTPSKEKSDSYAEVQRLEQLIETKDAQIIKEMIDYRGYFWT